MGRKIPAKKHRGVKDPLIQQAKRIQELKGKINAPPTDPDDQPVPKSLTRLFAFENQIKEKGSNLKKKKKQHSNVRDNIKSQNDNPVAKLLKLPGETGRSFTMRINGAIKAIHSPTLQDHYPLDIEAEDSKGEKMALQRARRKRKQNKVMANTGEEPPAKLSRSQKLALKKKAKKEKALECGTGGGGERGEVRRERVAFGEVAHAPPALAVRPRRAAAGRDDRKPGRKELLLSAMLGAGAGAGAEAERRERARLAAVAAYRALRARAAPRPPYR